MKKKTASGVSAVSLPKPQPLTTNKDKDSAAIKLRRKSSTPIETTNNPVVVLRRKSYAGATDALRKKTVENGTSTLGNAAKGGVS